MKTQTIIKTLCAGTLASVLSASAGILSLPTPPPSEYSDAESSDCVPLDPSRGPLMRLRIEAAFTPSNAVIVAFGTDANADGDLSPEETVVRLGVDCGVPFVGKESKSKVEVEQWNLSTYSAGQPEQGYTHLCSTSTSDFDYSSPSPSTSDFDFVLKQPSDVSRRYDLAKLTTHNFTSTNLVVRLSRIGTTIFVR